MNSNSESDEESSVGASSSRVLEWEIVNSDFDSVLSDSNGHDGQLHDDVHVHLQHFSHPGEASDPPAAAGGEAGDSPQGSNDEVKDWIEPSTSQAVTGVEHEFDTGGQSRELELLSSLVSSVLDDGKGGEEESLALQREILSEAGFSSLVPSDHHGNVLRPEEQDGEVTEAEEDGEPRWGVNKLVKLGDCIKRASTLWSITIAAALMGLVIIGQRWHHARWQSHQLRLQLCCKDEKISQLLFQIARLKEAVSGRRRVPVIKASSV